MTPYLTNESEEKSDIVEKESEEKSDTVSGAETESSVDGVVLHHNVFNSLYYRLHTLMDGNCFFHSLCTSLNYDHYRDVSTRRKIILAKQLRQKILSRNHWNSFVATQDSSLLNATDNMGNTIFPTFEEANNPTYHADEFIWRFTAQILNIGIIVVKSPSEIYVTPDNINDVQIVIIMAWINDCHFESIVTCASNNVKIPLPPIEYIYTNLQVLQKNNLAYLSQQPCKQQFVGIFTQDDTAIQKLLVLHTQLKN